MKMMPSAVSNVWMSTHHNMSMDRQKHSSRHGCIQTHTHTQRARDGKTAPCLLCSCLAIRKCIIRDKEAPTNDESSLVMTPNEWTIGDPFSLKLTSHWLLLLWSLTRCFLAVPYVYIHYRVWYASKKNIQRILILVQRKRHRET